MCVYKIEEIQKIVTPIAKEYGFNKVYLFGSYARQNATEQSDVDLYVENSNVLGIKFFGFCSDVEDALHKPVDIITKDALYNATNRKINQQLIANIENERVCIYEC